MSDSVIRKLITLFGFEVDRGALRQGEQAVDRGTQSVKRQGDVVAATTGRLRAMALRWIGLGTVMAGLRSLFEVNAEFQALSANMETVEGSADAAIRAMGVIEQMASDTPFQLQGLTQAWIDLRNAGLDPTTDMLTSLGDIAAANGKDITEMSQAVMGAVTGEMERLKAFGIMARQQGDQVTFTFRGVETTVRRDSAAIIGYLTELGDAEFAGGMGRMMATLKGHLSNLGDAFAAFMRRLGDAGASDAMIRIIDAIKAFFSEGTGDSVQTLGLIIGFALDQIAQALEWVHENAQFVKVVLLSLGGAMLLSRLFALASAIMSVNFAALALPAALIAIAILIGLVVEDLIGYMQGHDSLIGRLIDRYGALKGFFPSLLRAIGNFATNATDYLEALRMMTDDVRSSFAELVDEIQNNGLRGTIMNAVDGMLFEHANENSRILQGRLNARGLTLEDVRGPTTNVAPWEMRPDVIVPVGGRGGSTTVQQTNHVTIQAEVRESFDEVVARVPDVVGRNMRHALAATSAGAQ